MGRLNDGGAADSLGGPFISSGSPGLGATGSRWLPGRLPLLVVEIGSTLRMLVVHPPRTLVPRHLFLLALLRHVCLPCKRVECEHDVVRRKFQPASIAAERLCAGDSDAARDVRGHNRNRTGEGNTDDQGARVCRSLRVRGQTWLSPFGLQGRAGGSAPAIPARRGGCAARRRHPRWRCPRQGRRARGPRRGCPRSAPDWACSAAPRW